LHAVEEFVYPFADIVRWFSLADADYLPCRVLLHGASNGLSFLLNQLADYGSNALTGAAGLLPEKAMLPFGE